MKKILWGFMLCVGLAACKNRETVRTVAMSEEQQRDRVEVLYFHGAKRCVTCMAIEEQAQKVVEEQFARQVRDSSLVFNVVDLSNPDNKELAAKYGVAWSSLFITRWREGKDSTENLTLNAFAKARSAPEAFQKELIRKIETWLR